MTKPGGWISGSDVMQKHGVLAVEIGRACYDGKLRAYTETGTQVLEETRLAHIPKYPPVGVNPFDHIQYTHSPEWEWGNQLKAEDFNEAALDFVRNARAGVYGKEIKHLYEGAMEPAVLLLMRTAYNYCSNEIKPPVATHCFRIDDYASWLNNNPNYAPLSATSPERSRAYARYGKPRVTRDEAFPLYEGTIKKLLFQRSEVDAWLQLLTAEQEALPLPSPLQAAHPPTDSPDEPANPSSVGQEAPSTPPQPQPPETPVQTQAEAAPPSTGSSAEPASPSSAGQKTIVVPRALWEGKHPSRIRDDMRKAGYNDFVIAYVLYEWLGERNNQLIGRILFVPRNPDHPERGSSDDALRMRSQKLRQLAKKFTIVPD